MEKSPQLQEEQKLERRGWVSCLLQFVLLSVLIALIAVFVRPGSFLALAEPAGLVSLVAFVIVGFVFVLLWLRFASWSTEPQRWRHRQGTDVFGRLLPGLGIEQYAPMPTRAISRREWTKFQVVRLLIAGGIASVALVVDAIVSLVLTDLPGSVRIILDISLVLGVWYLIKMGVERARIKPSAAAESPKLPVPQQVRSGRWRAVALVLYLVVLFVPLIGVFWILNHIPMPTLLAAIVALGVCGVVLMAGTVIYVVAPSLWIVGAVKRSEYDRAITRARLIERLSTMPGFYLNTHGVILLWAGRYDDARTAFEESIREQRVETMGGGSGALENIGCALAWQGQYEEAIKMFEGSIAISPGQVMVYSDLAEVLLYQGSDLPRALELTQRAWENQQASLEARWLSSYQAGQILATRAWALARLGRHQEAEETVARAFAIADRTFRPVLAGIYLRAGYVALERADVPRAKEYFGQGQQLDTNGHYGRRCVEAMQKQT